MTTLSALWRWPVVGLLALGAAFISSTQALTMAWISAAGHSAMTTEQLNFSFWLFLVLALIALALISCVRWIQISRSHCRVKRS